MPALLVPSLLGWGWGVQSPPVGPSRWVGAGGGCSWVEHQVRGLGAGSPAVSTAAPSRVSGVRLLGGGGGVGEAVVGWCWSCVSALLGPERPTVPVR